MSSSSVPGLSCDDEAQNSIYSFEDRPGVCELCGNLDYRHHPPTEDIERWDTSVSSGCPGCSLVVAVVRSFGDEMAINEVGSVTLLRYEHMIPTIGPLKIRVFPKQSSHSYYDIKFLKTADTSWPFQNEPRYTGRYPKHTKDDESLHKALAQLQKCDATHTCLIPADDSYRFPTRVLDISHECVRLCSPRELKKRYIALSHVWSSHADFTTTQTNIETRMHAIPWEEMPLTYRDAIIFGRKMGIDYIWIDSLCIIQDDALDWEREAANMADVFRFAYVTIGADLYQDGLHTPSDGCFSRVPSSHQPQTVTLPHPCDKSQTYTLNVLRGTWTHHPGPLSTRGWIFQERLLAPRFIWCTPFELIFNCFQPSCFCDDPPDRGWWHDNMIAPLRPVDTFDFRDKIQWRNIVRDYNKLRLTYEKDVFPALSGLAKTFRHDATKFYVAGLWTDDMIKGLSWGREDPLEYRLEFPTHQRPAQDHAPTWSWGCMRGMAEYSIYQESYNEEATVQDVSVRPKGIDPAGELLGGHLTISGRVIDGILRWDESESKIWADLSIPTNPPTTHTWQLFPHHFDYGFHLPGPQHVPSSTPIKLLRLLKHPADMSISLILTNACRPAEQVFQRIGLVSDAGESCHYRDCPAASYEQMNWMLETIRQGENSGSGERTEQRKDCSEECQRYRRTQWDGVEEQTVTIV